MTTEDHKAQSVTVDDLIRHMNEAEVRARQGDLEKLRLIARLDRARVWERDGCRDMVEWVAGHFKKTSWVARQWVRAAHALEGLPRTSGALARGEICLEKTIELTRFVTPDSERHILRWARRVTPKGVRDRADRCERESRDKVERAHRERYLHIWDAGAGRMALEGLMPAAEGAQVATLLDRLADLLPAHPDDDRANHETIEERRADALALLASRAATGDADLNQTNIHVHAELRDILNSMNGAQIEGGPIIQTEVLEQLMCDARIKSYLHDGPRGPVCVGHASRHPSPSLLRLLRRRDGGCVFPGCSQKRFVHAHHIVKWPKGPTEPHNMVLLCKVHHDLVHVRGWKVVLGDEGLPVWYRPAGIPYEPGVRFPMYEDSDPYDDEEDQWYRDTMEAMESPEGDTAEEELVNSAFEVPLALTLWMEDTSGTDPPTPPGVSSSPRASPSGRSLPP